MKKDTLIIYSGGMDSTTLLYEKKEEIALAVSFNYGSKHNDKELGFARFNCHMLKIKHITIDLDFISKYFKSSLLKSGGEIPEGHYKDNNMKSTVVPYRNGIMLSIAAGIAESQGLKYITLANHFGDHAIYPDCRGSFIDGIKEAIKKGTYNEIEVLAPYTNLNKTNIAHRGLKLGIDYKQTWTCYKGGIKHCGKCGACVERKEALLGYDTTEYEE